MALKCGLVSFYDLGYFMGNEWEIISTIWGKGQSFLGIGLLPIFWSLMVNLGTVMVPLGMSFSLLMSYNEHILRIKV